MPNVTVHPEAFTMVSFDADRIAAIAAELAEGVGLPDDTQLHLEIEEGTPRGHTSMTISGRRVELAVGGGAFEDPKRLRHLSEPITRAVLGRLLYRVLDRLSPDFGDPLPDAQLTFAQHAAWDTYALGRYARAAVNDGGKARWRYHFRLRHGFTDVADQVFDRLWSASGLTWAELESACAETRQARPQESGPR